MNQFDTQPITNWQTAIVAIVLIVVIGWVVTTLIKRF